MPREKQISLLLRAEVRKIKLKRFWDENMPDFEETIKELDLIAHTSRVGGINIVRKPQKDKPSEDAQLNKAVEDTKVENKTLTIPSDIAVNEDTGTSSTTQHKKGRGRATKQKALKLDEKSTSLESIDSLDCSTTSTRSRRAAAQAAEQNLTQVYNFIKAKKLRRPTDFNEKKEKNLSPPPAKCRRTNKKTSAGSSKENSDLEEVNKVNLPCTVSVELMSTSVLTSLSHRRSRSVEEVTCDRKSGDLFNDWDSARQNETATTNSNVKQTVRNSNMNKTKQRGDKDPDSGVSSEIGEPVNSDLHNKGVPTECNYPETALSPLSEGEFNGFNLTEENNLNNNTKMTRGTFVKYTAIKQEIPSEGEEIQANSGSTVKVSSKKNTKMNVNEEDLDEKENSHPNDQITINHENSPVLRSRTKTLRKASVKTKIESKMTETVVQNENDLVKEKNKLNTENVSHVAVKNNSNESDGSDEEVKIRSRTKTIRKAPQSTEVTVNQKYLAKQPIPKSPNFSHVAITNNSKDTDSTDEEVNIRTRTKTIRKAPQSTEETLNQKYLAKQPTPKSPAPARGKLVKKRVENFENMKNTPDPQMESTGRITRHTARGKGNVVGGESAKQTRNVHPNKALGTGRSASKSPLVTPSTSSTLPFTVANKVISSANHKQLGDTTSLVQKQNVCENAEKKKKEEQQLKRQLKEEDAKKKKTTNMKAAAAEARRKREEKLQKVAAVREAAEKEKALLAAKAEKEKEEKLQKIAADKKQKLKEEQWKKKQLLQQRALEQDERRKQEEAARAARLKEQEEEYKRAIAMKEREQQRIADLRLAEAERAKHQPGTKLAKVVAANRTLEILQAPSTNVLAQAVQKNSPVQSYEMTPAKEDRPLQPPKTETNYGIDDAHSGDSSDEESQPKKAIPLWAQAYNRARLLHVTNCLTTSMWGNFVEADACPDERVIFSGTRIQTRVRTSSAVWNTPPITTD